ncbi:hypothetical protein BFW01_g9718 [Lasiodiplodia theobromae]|uniref:Uncharacterized protein n=2 Tax=Lasiodiplodia TaxID=66739 RepID=A0A5N5DIT1_9PEZI|nr:Transcription factor [Lasiodiplodia theobromae]KAB2577637.1 hypothetical protein DBV05_g3804 [Lasiodiplodia theobromae]KAF4535537.1 Transcription factor [Lasiodiplodia theobromae]KAF9638821.1 hypothetical protein BFW01_g9718 [Lasiodiplodia theobromae]KAK0658113.1 hypothetical protein DIS24_g4874 [Lasiodiplodia hormozganensis]
MPGMAASLNNYFVPGYGISRAVIQGEIRYHCGPDAIVRPFTHQGRDGFLVTTAGPPLTKAQIEDIKEASREYEERQAERSGDDTEPFVNRPIPVKTGGRRSS